MGWWAWASSSCNSTNIIIMSAIKSRFGLDWFQKWVALSRLKPSVGSPENKPNNVGGGGGVNHWPISSIIFYFMYLCFWRLELAPCSTTHSLAGGSSTLFICCQKECSCFAKSHNRSLNWKIWPLQLFQKKVSIYYFHVAMPEKASKCFWSIDIFSFLFDDSSSLVVSCQVVLIMIISRYL